jgi:hypothetical protein
MSLQTDPEEKYHIATLVVWTLTGLVILFYTIIFINPRVAFNPFKPPLPTSTLLAVLTILPPTWTPTVTSAPTPSATPTLAPTATRVIAAPTLPPPTATTLPTLTPSATPRPPTPTRTATATPLPTSVASPTIAMSTYPYRPVLSCSHSGGTQIKGTVSSGGQSQEGVRVRVATSPDVATVIEEQFTRRQPDGSAGYAFILKAIGAFDPPATWYVWIVDGTGNPLSDPNFHFQTNNYPPDNPLACWLAIVDFVK